MSLNKLAEDIETSCRDIRRSWSSMFQGLQSPSLQPRVSGGGRESMGRSTRDNSRSNEDVSQVDAVISLRVEVERTLAKWCDVVIRDVCPDGGRINAWSVESMCRFIELNARMMSGHADAEAMAAQLTACAHEVEQIVCPPVRKGVKLGSCTVVTCRGIVLADPTDIDEDTGAVLGRCNRCGVVASIDEWAELMNVEMETAITAKQVIALAKRSFCIELTQRAVEGLVRRGTLVPVDDSRPQKYSVEVVVRYLTERAAGR